MSSNVVSQDDQGRNRYDQQECHVKTDTDAAGRPFFEKTVTINAPPAAVWQQLTTLAAMPRWMLPGSDLTISTDWTIGSPLIMHGTLNQHPFENRGLVLQWEPERTLQYSHLSSTSHLPDRPESYTIVTFQLQPRDTQTMLTLTLTQAPTESIAKHLAFYWSSTLEVLKQVIETPG